jgi:poly(beta-D-mannuronate) lyase
VQQWFVKAGRRQQVFFDDHVKRFPQLENSHDHRLFLAGYAVMSAAIAADDRRLYEWGLSTFREGANKIDKNGMMSWERCGGGLTAKCHLEAVASLVMMAEYGAYNGDSLYEYKNGALRLLVKSAIAGLADPNTFRAFSDGEAQHLPSAVQPWEIGWAEPYQRRFPDAEVARLLKASKSHRYIGWGGTPAP